MSLHASGVGLDSKGGGNAHQGLSTCLYSYVGACSTAQFCDYNCIRLCSSTVIVLQVLAGLATVSWDRVVVTAPSSLWMRKTAHDFVIGKNQPASVQADSEECCSLITDMMELFG